MWDKISRWLLYFLVGSIVVFAGIGVFVMVHPPVLTF